MALSFSTLLHYPAQKGIRQRIVLITLDTDYPANGWPITAANVELTALIMIFPMASVGGYVFEWDDGAAKMKAYWGDNNNTSDGVLVEIATGDNGIANLVLPCLVIGR